MKKISLIISLLFYFSHSFAQQDSILRNFKFRISNYRVISIGINQNAEYGKTKLALYNAENIGTSGNLYGILTTIRSTDKLQLSITTGTGTTISFSRNNNQPGKTNYSAAGINGDFSVLGRWFNKNHFIELGTSLYGFTNSQKTKFVNTNQTEKYAIGNYHFTIYTGIGTGRLENITDMQNALWLNKTLEESSDLSRKLTPEELNELGKSITRGNNTRVLDARRKTQFVLRTVDGFLQSKGLISKTDINYFTRLNDIIFFAFNNSRLSGTEKFIRFTPDIWGNNSMSNSTSTNNKLTIKPQTKSALVTIGFNTYKPLNLTHQINYGGAVKLNYTDYTSTRTEYLGGVLQPVLKLHNTVKQAGVDLFFTHAIYPNTRTIVSLTAETELGWQDDNMPDNSFYEKTGINANFDYFISYHTRLFINAGISHNKNYYNNFFQVFELYPDRFNASFNTGLTINL